GIVVERTNVNRVFPGEPRMARRLQLDENLAVLLAGTNLLKVAHFTGFSELNILFVALRKSLAVQLWKITNFGWIKQVPVLVLFNTLHKLITQPDGGVCKTSTKVGVT